MLTLRVIVLRHPRAGAGAKASLLPLRFKPKPTLGQLILLHLLKVISPEDMTGERAPLDTPAPLTTVTNWPWCDRV